jgi:hypothetical protein
MDTCDKPSTGGGSVKRVLGIFSVLAGLSIALLFLSCGDESVEPCCRIRVVSPNGGEHWTPGETYTVRWCADGPCGDHVRIDLYQYEQLCSTLTEAAPNCGTFAWTAGACGAGSTGYRIRVSSVESDRYDESNAPFSISVEPPPPACTIALVTPVGEERFEIGSPIAVEWSGSATCCDSVLVELLHDGSACDTLLTDASHSGTLSWTAVACAADSEGYAIRVTEQCNGSTNANARAFTLYPPAPGPQPCALEITSPNGGEEYIAGGNVPITWSRTGVCSGNVQVELLQDGVVCATIAASTPNDGGFAWTAARCGGDTGYRIRVTDPVGGEADESDAPFTVLAPCSITLTAPDGGEQWIEGEPATITWQSAGACGDSVDIRLARAGGPCGELAVRVPDTGSFTWPAAARCDNERDGYRVTITGTAAGSGASDASAGDFRILDAAVAHECTLSYLGPAGGGTYCPGDPVQVAWSENGECSPTVKIELLRHGSVCATIAPATDNDGAFVWAAAPCAGDASGYLIRITDPASQKTVAGTTPFSVRPVCAIDLGLLDDSDFCAGELVELTWTSGACCGPNVRIELLQNGRLCRTLAASTANDGSFTWAAGPCGGPDGYAIRVTDPTNGASEVTADFRVHPACALEITSVLDDFSFCVGDDVTIQWTSTACCGPTVKVELLHGGQFYRTLAEAAPNNGLYIWPAALFGSQTAGYAIRVTDPAGGVSDRTVGTFEIRPGCALEITAPVETAAYCEGEPIAVAWRSSSCCGEQVRVELLQAGEVIETLSAATENDGSFIWNTARVQDQTDDYSIRVTELTTGASDETTAHFRILPPCGITLTAPAGADFCQGEPVDIVWQASPCCDGPTVRLELLRNGEVCETIDAETANDGRHAWTAQRCADASDGYTIRVTELASGVTDVSDAPFTIRPACVLAVTAPVAGGAYCEGANVQIGWTRSECCGAAVKIELLHAGRVCRTIAASTENDGSYTWPSAPCDGDPSGYTIRVTDLTTATGGTSAESITLNALCSYTITYPAQGDLICKGDDALIAWQSNSTCCGANVKLDLYHYDTFVRTIAATTPNDGEHLWTNALQYDDFLNGYAIVIKDLTSGRVSRGEGAFSIWTGQITLSPPEGGPDYCEGAPVAIGWNSSPCAGGTVKIELLRNGAVCRTIVNSTANDGEHVWPAERCGAFTDNYKIRVSDRESGRYDESEVAFAILPPCAVGVTAPEAGANYCGGDEVPITWQAGGECCGETVRIELLHGGVPCIVIAAETENDGSFAWPAADCGGDPDGYTIRVTDLRTLLSTESPISFTIRPACALAVTAPAGGGTLCAGEQLDIAWSSTTCCGEFVNIDLCWQGAPVIRIVENAPNTGSFSWHSQQWLDETADYTIRVSIPGSSLYDDSDAPFAINSACALDVLYPDGGEVLCRGDEVDLTWSSLACCGPLVKVELLNGDEVCRVISPSTENDGLLRWRVQPCEPGLGQIHPDGYRLRVTDLARHTVSVSERPFTIGGPCELRLTGPNGGEDFCRGTRMRIIWTAGECCGANVKIELLRLGRVFETLAESTANDGAFDYDIPLCEDTTPWGGEDPCPPSGGFTIRITDLERGLVVVSAGTFNINGPCELDVTAPAAGASYCVGANVPITWIRTACCASRVSIELLHDGLVCRTITAMTPNDGSYTWPAQQCEAASSGYAVRVTDLGSGLTDDSLASFAIVPCEAAPPAEGSNP